MHIIWVFYKADPNLVGKRVIWPVARALSFVHQARLCPICRAVRVLLLHFNHFFEHTRKGSPVQRLSSLLAKERTGPQGVACPGKCARDSVGFSQAAQVGGKSTINRIPKTKASGHRQSSAGRKQLADFWGRANEQGLSYRTRCPITSQNSVRPQHFSSGRMGSS